MRVLLIEDDVPLGDSIRNAIKSEGYACDWVQSCQEATSAVKDGFFNLIILDRILPDGDGANWLSRLRSNGFDIPVLMLSARTSANDKVIGLDRGADDYLTKPFDLDEFFARVRALTRRGRVTPSRSIVVGNITIDPDTSLVSVNEKYIDLSKTEFDLLLILAKRSGLFVSKSALEDALYDWDSSVTQNAIERQISRLRKKIGPDSITTRRGFGYKLEALT